MRFLNQELIATHHVVVAIVLLLLLLGATLFEKKPKALSFQIRSDEICQDCSTSKFASINGVGFLTFNGRID